MELRTLPPQNSQCPPSLPRFRDLPCHHPNHPAPLIGYFGQLSGEKDFQNFAQVLPAILNDRQDLRALVGGDGQLRESIEAPLQERRVIARVALTGYLNTLPLLVLSFYTERLPNIMLKAMACGPLCLRCRSGRYRML